MNIYNYKSCRPLGLYVLTIFNCAVRFNGLGFDTLTKIHQSQIWDRNRKAKLAFLTNTVCFIIIAYLFHTHPYNHKVQTKIHIKLWNLSLSKWYHRDRQFPLTDAKQFGISSHRFSTVTSGLTSEKGDSKMSAFLEPQSLWHTVTTLYTVYSMYETECEAEDRSIHSEWA